MVSGGGVICLEHLKESFGVSQRDARGNVALLFAFSLIPLLIGVGVAMDYGRALIVRERMADAADAAALAIGSWPGLTQDELKIKAQQFFDANLPADHARHRRRTSM